jgi:hypothetical protein
MELGQPRLYGWVMQESVNWHCEVKKRCTSIRVSSLEIMTQKVGSKSGRGASPKVKLEEKLWCKRF